MTVVFTPSGIEIEWQDEHPKWLPCEVNLSETYKRAQRFKSPFDGNFHKPFHIV